MHSILSASLFVSAAGSLSLVAGFASSVIIARMLGPEGTGLTAFAFWLAMSGYAIAGLGIPAIVLRYNGRHHANGTPGYNFSKTVYPFFLLPVILFAAGLLLYSFLDPVSGSQTTSLVWLITAFVFLFYAHGHFMISINHSIGRYSQTTKTTALGCLFQLPATALGAYFFGAPGAMVGYLVRQVPLCAGLVTALSNGQWDSTAVTPQMKRYGFNNWLSSLLNIFLRTRVELLFIGVFFSVTEVGYFAVAMAFPSLIAQMSDYLSAGLTPTYGSLKDSEALEKLQLSYERALRGLALLLAPISFGGAAVVPELIPMVFGHEFGPAVLTSVLLIAFTLPQSLSAVPLSIMLAWEQDQRLLVLNCLAAVALVALNLAITPFFGGPGAALIKGGVGLVLFVYLLHHCQVRLGLQSSLGALGAIVASAAMCGFVAYAIVSALGGLAGLAVAIPAGALVYGVMLRLTRAIPADDLDVVSGGLKKIAPAKTHAMLDLFLSYLVVRNQQDAGDTQ
ncbi:lipopolysaccharide biosynthesis protein [Roseibium denhamense]|uniref:Membrane protein involved in the export of O-antigen and teichoic acid n=1 Tax=Roseibium denhamense TaxID=76305 RepID=A0ABY1PI84_9HYPH|nr:lipopolysaccharide biosynthesis protein [Roseibium denhamense]MTI05559.1 lipopolysaccharide biosynthesis protein [Roseibium denhamense]SMP34941.1 Membrane protein involved in the export of O-antigen and teichoic acid [Roseibium denhamense]